MTSPSAALRLSPRRRETSRLSSKDLSASARSFERTKEWPCVWRAMASLGSSLRSRARATSLAIISLATSDASASSGFMSELSDLDDLDRTGDEERRHHEGDGRAERDRERALERGREAAPQHRAVRRG